MIGQIRGLLADVRSFIDDGYVTKVVDAIKESTQALKEVGVVEDVTSGG